MKNSLVLGIDLGTTFCCMAIINKHGKTEVLPNREGDRITPSVIMFDEDSPIVGSIAKRSAVASPLNTVQFVKRQMGNHNYNFITENGQEFKAEEISAIILKRLKEDAEIITGETIKDAVVTVPAYFDDAQRKSTEDAGKIAGLNVLRIINEPTAAALAYGIDKVDQQQTVVVYDLGGGTFDVTIIKITKNKIDVIATGGDRNLGGFDWDNAIMKYLNEEFQKQDGVDLFADPTLEQDLRDKAEVAKKTLSSKSKTQVFLSAGGKNTAITLTRETFEEITNYLLEKTADIMEMVLEDAELEWKDIDKTLLVGGSTRMSGVVSLVEKVTGKKPSLEVNPDEVVAIGAALQGALLQIKEGNTALVEAKGNSTSSDLVEFSKVTISDVNSHSLGIVALNGSKLANSIVMEKNTKIPGKVGKTFYTVQDNQTQLKTQVTEGEDSDLRYVKILGEALISIAPHPANSPIEVFFEYDANGIVHVTVYDLASKPKKYLGEIKIKRTSNMDEEEVKESTQKITHLAIG